MSDHVGELLHDYIDFELPEAQVRAVDEHLAACLACSRRLRALRRTIRFIQGNAATEITPDAIGGTLERVNRAIMRSDVSDSELASVIAVEAQRLVRWG